MSTAPAPTLARLRSYSALEQNRRESVRAGASHHAQRKAHDCHARRVPGDNEYGQLGIPDYEDRNMPTQNTNVQLLEPVSLACGDRHTLVVARNGDVWGFGSNSAGQLGLPASVASLAEPHRMPLPAGVHWTRVVASASHSLAVGEQGDFVTWGANIASDGPEAAVDIVPRRLSGPPMISACTGRGHALAISVAAPSTGPPSTVLEQQDNAAAALLPQELLYKGYLPAEP